MITRIAIAVTLVLCSHLAKAQTPPGVIKGRVFDETTNEPVAFANVALQNTTLGAVTDLEGRYTITGITPGLYNVQCSFVGYQPRTIFEVEVFAKLPTTLNIALRSTGTELQAVEITTAVFEQREESPLSLQTIGTNEIQRNPGGNRDISRAIQVLPGVASSLSFRNDIIIRGGAPNENRFYLDGIEIPVLNHFATQGSSGGPVGILNVNFIENVDFFAGSFPSNRGNALSSVLEFTQKEGNADRMRTNFTLGASEVGLTFDGPLGERTNYIFSVRRSYLQFLFGAIGLPFLPTYNDSQIRVKHRFNNKHEITIVGIGAFDTFRLNEDAARNETDPEERRRKQFLLGNLPINEQWNYTVGANYRRFSAKGFQNVVLSRSHLRNTAIKYFNNVELPQNLLLNYASEEVENKLRIENTLRHDGWRFNMGANAEHIAFFSSTFNRITLPGGQLRTIDFQSSIAFQRFGLFGSASKRFLSERLLLTGGMRMDWNNYAPSMAKPWEQFSPRAAAAYSISTRLTANAGIARYYQLPAYTVFGYRDQDGRLANRENGVTCIRADHATAGFQYVLPRNTKVSIEGFYKWYDGYPFSLRDSISLANLGADFGVIGNEPVVSTGRGRAYGLEFLIQRKLYNGLYGIAALTLVRSEFTDRFGTFVPATWDNRFLLTLTAGKKLPKNWEIGLRLRALGGTPFTPVDVEASSRSDVWDVNGRGIPDFTRLNTLRNPNIYQLDARIDKKYFFPKWSLNVYFDVENATGAVFQLEPFLDVQRDGEGNPILDVQRDGEGNPIVNPEGPQRYLLTSIPNTVGFLLPTLGVVIEF